MSPIQTLSSTSQLYSDPPIVISTYPDSAQRDVYLNTLLKVTFNQNMDSTSITDTTFLLVKQDTYDPVDGTITYSYGTRTATFQPDSNLDADSTYIAIVVGNQDEHARIPQGVKNSNNEPMVGNYSWQFYTGFSVSSDPDIAALASGVTGYEEPEYPGPSGYDKSGYMEISWTSPENYDSNVDVSGTLVTIQLSDDLELEELSGLGQMIVGEDYIDSASGYLSYYINVENSPVLGDQRVSSNTWQYDIYYNQFLNQVVLSGIPTTIAADGYYDTNGIWQTAGTLYGILEENNEYVVTIKAGLAGLNTYPMQEDYVFMFTTTFDPLYSSVVKIRANIGPLIRDIPDDTINRLIHENSIVAQQLYPSWAGLIDPDNIPYYVSEYVTCKTKLDVLNAAMLGWAGAGGRKTLADLTIAKDSVGRDLFLLASKKIEELEKCIYEMKNLVETAGEPLRPDYAVIGKDQSRRPITDNSWRRLPRLNPKAIARPGTAKALATRGLSRRSLLWGRETGEYGSFQG